MYYFHSGLALLDSLDDDEISRMNRALSFTQEEEKGLVIPRELWAGGARVSLDVRRPLFRKTKIRSLGQEMVITFAYERLGNFCYLCGILGHMEKFCDLRYGDDFVDLGLDTPYGP
ncbi:hypothetical protein Salat_2424300 [Sesamum alatum]|uniref:Zinc knuckle CX2CX4HX4C domain-containing protein n=1 Tax=Sesamum alatum TaxID=300844 RepID=A0AAE1XY40_9LAMI|nr:hypothetical protein Salat_2424300 [Sesamum alatum]